MKLARWTGVLAMLVACGVGGPGLSAQTTTGSIIGTIRADQGSVGGTQVTVRNAATGFSRSVIASEAGRYIIPGLEIGTYQVTTTSIGFASTTKTATVSLGQATRVDFDLTTQAVELEGITATAAQATGVISPTRTGILTTVPDSALHRLPSLNRNFTDFVTLTPQVSTTLPNGGLSGGGVNNRYNQVQIDGTNETDMFGLGSTGQPGGQADGKSIGIEAVKEYQVLLAPFDVRHGNFAGLLINAVTKSGTNQFHGSVYGYGRNQSLVRNQEYINNFSQYQYGATLGGPIVQDKILFFANAEWQSYNTPAQGVYEGLINPDTKSPYIATSDINAAISALEAAGIPTGSPLQVSLHKPLTNIFARVDFTSLPHNSSLTLRYNYGHAVSGALPSGTTTLALTSNQYQYASTKNAPALELRTNFSSGAFNELRLSHTRIRDPRTATGVKDAPQVTVYVPGGSIVSGTERYSQGNEVDQDITELVDNVTLPFGRHTVVIGTQNEFYKVRNLYAQSVNGVWSFDSVDSLSNGLPYSYIVGVPAPGTGDGSVRFRTATLAGYAEDQWSVTPNFTLTYGLRADVPLFLNRPPTNLDVVKAFDRDTRSIPTGHVQVSPRVGFNWDVTHDQRNQLRGGIGAFVGHPAYVWMSNAFQNSGLSGVNLLTCTRTAPAFNSTSIASPPTACSNGVQASAGSEIDLLQSSLRMPQTLRMSVGYDRDLGHNLIGTVEGLYTHAVYSPFYYNLALAGPQGVDDNGRVMYGPQPGKPVLKTSRSTVIDVANEDSGHFWDLTTGDHFYNLTAKLTRRFADNWDATAAYTYSRGWDVQSFTSSTAYSQYRYGRVWAGNQMDQTATRSSFEQRHRIVAQGSYTFPTNTTVSLMYVGASGIPYNFVASGDLNGDGLTYNDPIYVPTNARDPSQIRFVDVVQSGTVVYTAAQEAQMFEDYINSSSCLSKERGKIMDRNVCTAPWTNLLNLSVRQSLKTLTAQNVSLQLDVFNVANLLNKKWGRQGSTYSDISLLTYRGLSNGSTSTLYKGDSQPLFNFDPNKVTIVDFNNLASNYQLQLSLRYTF